MEAKKSRFSSLPLHDEPGPVPLVDCGSGVAAGSGVAGSGVAGGASVGASLPGSVAGASVGAGVSTVAVVGGSLASFGRPVEVT
jgi:hypothetical protein